MQHNGLPLPTPDGLELPFFTARSLLALDVPPMEWLVQDLVPAESINMLVASPGTGKSLFALDLALSCVTDRLFLGRAVRPGPVMYLAAEDGWKRVRDRVAQWVGHHGATDAQLDNFHIMPCGLQLTSAGDDRAIDRAVEAWHKLARTIDHIAPVVVFLDPFVDLHEGLDENDAVQMAGLMRHLRTLVRGQDRCLFLVHHDKKGVGEPGVYSARGSSALSGAVDGIYHLRAADDGGVAGDPQLRVSLSVTKGRDLPPNMKARIGMRLQQHRWVVDAAAAQPTKNMSRTRLLAEAHELLMDERKPVTVSEFQKLIDQPRSTTRRILDELVDAKLAIADDRRPLRFAALVTQTVA